MSELVKTVGVRMPAKLLHALDERAQRKRLKRADIIREIIWAEIDRLEMQNSKAAQPVAMEAAQ
jgi:metal-responsive CopG/Arc/MetJ family transcriptional regulator